MSRLTRWVLAHRRIIVVAWLVLTVAGGGAASGITARLGKTFTVPGKASFTTDAKILGLFHRIGGGQDPTVPVVTAPSGVSLTSPSVAGDLRRLSSAASLGGRYRVVDYATSGDRAFLTADRRSTYLLVFTGFDGFGSQDPTPALTAAIHKDLPPGWGEVTTGADQLQASTGASGGHGVFFEAILGGTGALVVLAIVFASLLAILPLIGAIVTIPTIFLLLTGLTEITTINFVVEFLIALVGLGVAIDYALLITTRWREEAQRLEPEEAVVVAMNTAGRSVVFSGVTVAIGLLSLAIIPVPFLRSLAYGGVLIPIVSVAFALTLLPIFLASFGPRLDRHRLRRADSASPPWLRWAALVDRHRIAATVAGLVLVGLAIIPVFSIRVGQPVYSSLSKSGPAHQGFQTLQQGGVPSGVLDPMDVLVSPAPRGVAIAAKVRTVPGVLTAISPRSPGDVSGADGLVTVLPRVETGASEGPAVVGRVRAAVAGEPGVIGVGGSGPESVDFDHALYDRFPLLLVVVAIVTFLVLVRAFRSLLLAAKAVVLNLVSLGAAYGVVVWIWQEGHASHALFGLPATGAVTNWVPLVMFAFLFGLAIDYEVFILARMRESFDETGSTSTAVVQGIGRTGRLVTSAAVILTLGFLSLSTAPLTFLKVLATGLSAGILIDAFIVRSLLVPALVSLFGRYNWLLPGPVERVLGLRPRQD